MPEIPQKTAKEQPPSVEVDLQADGVLWLINRCVFHPRGFALAIQPHTKQLSLIGDGKEPWRYELGTTEDQKFLAVEALLARCIAATELAELEKRRP